ncbi:(4Fe-4S)-binding protein [Deinococcus marmoris]|uniref:Iron-binding zinc finger CDGSH type domain-containing protein n=1 Tax=Deinococcus marmoris TaxID=249408 RepID=A0A1U7P122_9DEIO|nr:(4Fe-4S)-binding protein [Deinococcus marmoris]OLV18873.1 hypothetical protein BOO71_0004501 [Deinococcus marmoris]
MTDSDVPAHWGRAYTAPDITVYFDLHRCIHFAACIRGLPQVFDPKVHPWVQADAAPAGAVAEVVRRCPTGALHYTLTAGPEEAPAAHTTVAAVQDGPLFVQGDLSLTTASGTINETRAALCRCGGTQNPPYCDGSHRQIGFQAEGIKPQDQE